MFIVPVHYIVAYR